MYSAEELLAAVGVTGENNSDLFSVVGAETVTIRVALERQWAFADDQIVYSGPELESAELDAVLWVAGQRWMRLLVGEVISEISAAKSNRMASVQHALVRLMYPDYGCVAQPWTLLVTTLIRPGHMLARAIAEVRWDD
jgi:hypothetical protein